jgi:hypothetical protein
MEQKKEEYQDISLSYDLDPTPPPLLVSVGEHTVPPTQR